MRRALVVLILFALAAPGAAAAAPPRSWAAAEIRAVTQAGLLADDAAAFRPDDALTRGELAALVAGLTDAPVQPVAAPARPVTMAELNAALVRAVGLAGAAATFARTAQAASLAPPARFGSEVVTRLLGLRKNHPAGQDALERLPNDPASRAEAAYSAAQLLRDGAERVEAVRQAAAAFALPRLTPWQRRVLATAFRFVGYPYVWGGESEFAAGPLGPQAQGGFDCSGFVWRVYNLETYPSAQLTGALRGRTTFTMSVEVPRAARIPFARLQPGDVVFFGARGPRSQGPEIDHMGIYVAPGWIVHSSRHGTTLAPFTGWYLERFAWARRPLAETGVERSTPV